MRNREIIIGCVATLMLTGLVMVYSNTAVSCGTHPLMNRFLLRQIAAVVISVAAIAVFAHVDYHWLARYSRIFVLLTLAGLAALLVFGTRQNAAKRWLRLGPLSLQISEFAKIVIILYVAGFVSRKHEILRDFRRGFVPPVIVLGVTFGLIMLQPDFGTAVLIAAVAMTMLLVSGVRWKHVAPLAATAAPILLVLLRMKEYRWQRLIVFINPWADPQGAGYHVCQSLIALGSGGLTGVGPGRGLQKLGFLPEAETDFVFAVFGMEHGFVGCVLLIAVFAALVYAGLRVARAAPDVLGALLAVGITVLIGSQMLINIGVAASAMPTKGISLPLVSFGGSSILALSIGIGMLLNVSRHSPSESMLYVRGATRKEVRK